MEISNELEQLDSTISELQKTIRKKDAMLKLFEDKNFQELILKDYISEGLKLNARFLSQAKREQDIAEINREIMSIAKFEKYLYAVQQAAQQAELDLDEANNLRTELYTHVTGE